MRDFTQCKLDTNVQVEFSNKMIMAKYQVSKLK